MHLLSVDDSGVVRLTTFYQEIPPYAILSHTWGGDEEEVTFGDLKEGTGKTRPGYEKIRFCAQQASKDGLSYFWVDTCCIDKANLTELSEAITSFFRWYQDADKCYVYLSDVSSGSDESEESRRRWKPAFRKSRWFTRAWTLQELIAPKSLEFFSREGQYLGSKATLELQVHELTGIPLAALRGAPLSDFGVNERFLWAEKREAKRPEDKAYSLLGIFGVSMSLRYGEGSAAFDRLKRKAGAFLDANPVHLVLNRAINSLFTGRQEILTELETIVGGVVKNQVLEDPCRIVISGMGGLGKSEICLQLAERLRQLFWGVFWVDVSTASLAESGFLAIAERLEMPTKRWEDARQHLSNTKQPWLLILDNADDFEVDYQQYLPPGPSGVVLLTSRNAECQQYATTKWISLEGLPDAEARALLIRAAQINCDQHEKARHEGDAEVVAQLLQSHPLALIQAGSYIARGHCTLKDYPRVYELHRKRLLTFRPSQARSRYGDVYSTLGASEAILQSSNTESARDALRLLSVLAALGGGLLPVRAFETAWEGAHATLQTGGKDDEDLRCLTRWHISHLPPFISPDATRWDSFQLIEAINLLKSLSLVSTTILDNCGLCISMHPLVHFWAHDRLSATEQHETWVEAGCMASLFRSDLVFWQKHQRHLQPHVHALTSREMNQVFGDEPQAVIVRILMSLGWQMYKMRDEQRVLGLMDRLIRHLKLDPANIDPTWVAVYELRARILRDQGSFGESLSLMEQAVRIKEETLAEDDASRLSSQHTLARAYQACNQIQKALELMEHVVKVNEQTLAAGDRSRLASQHTLARMYQANGQTEQAVSAMEHVVKANEESLAEDHPTLLASQHVLAIIYRANGQDREALGLAERVVRFNIQSLPKEHPILLESQYQLAMAYSANGRDEEAAKLLESVVEIREQLLAANHPTLLLTRQSLAALEQKTTSLFVLDSDNSPIVDRNYGQV